MPLIIAVVAPRVATYVNARKMVCQSDSISVGSWPRKNPSSLRSAAMMVRLAIVPR